MCRSRWFVPRLLAGGTVLAITLLACAAPAAAPSKPASASPTAAPAPASSPQAPAAAQPAGGAAPVEIRLGHGFAAEENLWLMTARPDLTPNQGRAYTLNFVAFRGNADRIAAYEAGQIDGGTVAAPTGLFAAEQGLPFKLVASVARERQGAFNTTYLALEESGIRGPADVRGKTIGIVDFKSATDLWARAAVESAGLNPDRDVSFVVVPFPAMGEALRARRIDVGVFPEPFVTIEKRRGGVVEVWTSKTGVPFEEELLDIFLRPEFIAQHREAVRAFLSDFVATTRWYLDNRDEARRVLIDKGFVQTNPEIYLATNDYYREPTGRLTLDGLQQLQELHLKLGWQARRVNISDIVDQSLLP
ncbi:MAG TPA: ABC transporter substrate-binding protein [Chloroflexota bacterium]|nr:ABC transporter substrate-binding protein [Chloroflexota bacterium]